MTNKVIISDSSTIFINGTSIPVSSLSFSDISMHYHVGRGQTVRGIGSDVHYVYKHNVMTNVGEIEEDTWYALVWHLIEKAGETDLFSLLLEWCQQEVEWVKSKKETRRYALELHACRIFEDEEWCGFSDFQQMRIHNEI